MESSTTNVNISMRKRIWDAIIYGVGGAVGSRFLILLSGILVSNIVGKTSYGEFSHVNSTVTLFVTFSGLGISSTLTRFIAINKEDKMKIGKIIGSFGTIVSFFSIIMSLIMFLLAEQISFLTTENGDLSFYYQIGSLAMLFASLSSVQQSALLGFEQYKKSAIIELFRCFIYVIAAYFLSKSHGVTGAILALMLGFILKFILMLLVNVIYNYKNHIKLGFIFDKEIRHILFTFTIPAFISALFVIPVNWISNSLLVRNTSFDELAIFSVAQQWMTIITYIPSQLGQMRPIYADLYSRKQYKTLFKTVKKFTFISVLLVFGVSGLALIFAKPLLGLYGENYSEGVLAFRIMMIVGFVIVTQAQLGTVFETINKMWTGFTLNLVWSIILLGSFSYFVMYGSLGYALAYLIAYTCHVIVSYIILYFIRRKNNFYENIEN